VTVKQAHRRAFAHIAVLLLAALTTLRAHAAEVMPPAPPKYFNDFAGVAEPATQERLNRALEQLEKDTSSQIVVAVFPKMQSDSSLEDYTIRMLRAWNIGQKGKQNGALLAVFVQDRKMRIEVDYGLEGAIPDALAKRIIDDEIAPRFRVGDYDGGLSAGVNALIKAAQGEYKGTGRTVAETRSRNRVPWPLIIFFAMFVLIALSSFRRRGRGTTYSRRGRTNWGMWPIIIPGSNWGGGGGGGWSGGGGSGGSFMGGGGAGGGGGGASGSW
jgi:uncharacterized protein